MDTTHKIKASTGCQGEKLRLLGIDGLICLELLLARVNVYILLDNIVKAFYFC